VMFTKTALKAGVGVAVTSVEKRTYTAVCVCVDVFLSRFSQPTYRYR